MRKGLQNKPGKEFICIKVVGVFTDFDYTWDSDAHVQGVTTGLQKEEMFLFWWKDLNIISVSA